MRVLRAGRDDGVIRRVARIALVCLGGLVGLLVALGLRLGARSTPCRDTIVVEVEVAAACVVEQAAWWGLVLGAALGAGLVLALFRLASALRPATPQR